MGDVADDMISGFVCSLCGEFLDGDAPGYPRLCRSCEKDNPDDPRVLAVDDDEIGEGGG
jgi:hypothetical protein